MRAVSVRFWIFCAFPGCVIAFTIADQMAVIPSKHSHINFAGAAAQAQNAIANFRKKGQSLSFPEANK